MARTEIGEIYYRITGDNSGLKNTLNDSDQKANSFMGTLEKVGKALAGAFIVKQIFDVGKAIIGVASDANETASKFGVVFSSISDRANQTAADISESYGMSRNAAKDYLSGVGDILKGLEFTQSASLDTSASIVKLSADLVSFKNYAGGVEGATHAITSALLGERESLKGLGIAIGDADLKQFAADSGLVWENLDKQHQATLTLALITERAGNAIGDFERTQYGFANQVRVAEGNINNLQVTLGSKLLPVATLGVIAFNEIIKSVDKSAMGFGDWITSAQGAEQVASFIADVIGGLAGLFATIEPVISALGDNFTAIWDALSNGLDDLGGTNSEFEVMSMLMVTLSNALKIGGIAFAGMITLVLDLGKAFLEVGKTAGSFIGLISGDTSWDEFKSQVGNAGDSITKLGDDVIKTTKQLTGEIGKAWNNFGDDVDKTNQKALKSSMDMHDKVKKGANNVLLANNKTNEDGVANVEKTEKDKTKISLDEAEKRIAVLQSYYDDAIRAGNTEEAAHYKNELSKFNDYKGFLKDRADLRESEFQEEKKKFEAIQKVASTVMSSVNDLLSGLSTNIQANLDQTLATIDASSNAQLAALDAQLAAELEAAGLTEQTNLEKLQTELDAAIAAGDTETAAQLQDQIDRENIISEYEDKKAKLEENTAKQKAQAEYKAAKQQWDIQKVKAGADLALAIMQATISGLQFGPAAPVMVPVLVAIATAAGIANIDAISKAKPQAPAFATGGIVPGSAFSGDQITAKVNSGEMILNQEQQAKLFNMANGGGNGGNYFTFMIDSETLYDKFYTDSKNGKFRIHKRAVTAL